MKDDEEKLIWLFDGERYSFVHRVQGLLSKKGISSTLMSTDKRLYSLRPTGILVMQKDFNDAQKIYNEYKIYSDNNKSRETPENKKLRNFGLILTIFGVLFILIFQFFKN